MRSSENRYPLTQDSFTRVAGDPNINLDPEVLDKFKETKKNDKALKLFIPYISKFLTTYQKARQKSEEKCWVKILHLSQQIFKSCHQVARLTYNQTPLQKSQWNRYKHLQKKCQLQMSFKAMQTRRNQRTVSTWRSAVLVLYFRQLLQKKTRIWSSALSWLKMYFFWAIV